MREFKQEMAIDPGESVTLPIEIFEPDLVELIRRGEVSIDVTQGPQTEVSPDHFRREFTIYVNGEPYQKAVLTYHAYSDRMVFQIAKPIFTARKHRVQD